MKKAVLVILFAMPLCCLAALASAAPTQWTTATGGNGHWYELVVPSSPINWYDAEAQASSSSYLGLSGHLLTVTSQEENFFVGEELASGISANLDFIWLGGFQQPGSTEPDGGWTWVTAEPFIYEKWAGNEPNNSGAGGLEENHLVYSHGYDGLGGGKEWNDLNGGLDGLGYIVEYESSLVPEPVSALLFSTGLLGMISLRRKRKHV